MSRQNPQMDGPTASALGGFDEPDGGYCWRASQLKTSIPGLTSSSRSQPVLTPASQTMEDIWTGAMQGPSQPRRHHTDILRVSGRPVRQTRSRPQSLIEGNGGNHFPEASGHGSDSAYSDCNTSDASIRLHSVDGPPDRTRISKSRDTHSLLLSDTGYSSDDASKKSQFPSVRSHAGQLPNRLDKETFRQPPGDPADKLSEDYGDECGQLPFHLPSSGVPDGWPDAPTDVPRKHGPTGKLANEQLLSSAMVKVAGMISSLTECTQLATALGFSACEVLETNSFNDITAYSILNKWIERRGRQATGWALWNALERIDLTGVAEECRDLLLDDVLKEGPHLQRSMDQSPRIGRTLQENSNHCPPITDVLSANISYSSEHTAAADATTNDIIINPSGADHRPAVPAEIHGGYHALFDPPLEAKHTCSMCGKALRDPMQTECGHRFCKVCVEPLIKSSSAPAICPASNCNEPLTEIYPDNFCRREVLSLNVKCINTAGGCHWSGQLLNLETHMKTCKHGLQPCPNRQLGCMEMLRQSDIQKHVEERCQFRSYICPYCREVLVFSSIQKHLDEDCLEYAQLCPAGCKKTIKRSELQDHLWKYCPMVDRCCPLANLGCQVKGKQIDLERHMHDQAALFDHMSLVGEHLLGSSNQLKSLPQAVADQHKRLEDAEKSLQEEKKEHEQTKARLAAAEVRFKDFEKQLAAFQARLDERPSQQATVSRHDDQVSLLESKLSETERKAMQAEASATTAKQNVETNRLKVAGLERQVASFNQIITRTDAIMAEFDLRLLSQETSSFNGTLIWKIPDFNRHFEEARSGHKPSLYSPPFYSSRHGYKMCARVYLNGDGSGKNTHMSIFFVVMRGEFDALLQWPFHQKVTLTLLDQTPGRSNVSDTFQPDPRSSSFQRPISEMNIASGCPKFVPHETLRSSNYLKNNTIFIRVAVDLAGVSTY